MSGTCGVMIPPFDGASGSVRRCRYSLAAPLEHSPAGADKGDTEHRLDERSPEERRQAELDRLAPPQEDGKPAQPGQEESGMAEREGNCAPPQRAIPAALGEPAGQDRGKQEADEIAAGRPRHIGQADTLL